MTGLELLIWMSAVGAALGLALRIYERMKQRHATELFGQALWRRAPFSAGSIVVIFVAAAFLNNSLPSQLLILSPICDIDRGQNDQVRDLNKIRCELDKSDCVTDDKIDEYPMAKLCNFLITRQV